MFKLHVLVLKISAISEQNIVRTVPLQKKRRYGAKILPPIILRRMRYFRFNYSKTFELLLNMFFSLLQSVCTRAFYLRGKYFDRVQEFLHDDDDDGY